MTSRGLLAAVLLASTTTSMAEEADAVYDNSVRVEYQFIRTGDLDTSLGAIDIGKTDTHVILLSGDYWLNDRWKLFASIPYVQKRHKGAGVHDPVMDFVWFQPDDLRLIDDGSYHGGFQDLFAGVQYLAIDGPFSVAPFISYGLPMSDYPLYGNAAIGKHVWEIPVGVSLEFTPHFSDWYFQAEIAYVFAEEVQNVNIDYWLLYASASYFITPRFAPRLFLTSRNTPKGTRFPEDYTDDFSLDDFDNAFWYNHDRMLKHNAVNGGIGFDFIASDRHQVSATYYTTLDPDNVAEVDYAFTLAFTRRF
jgi:hypothetical protein